VNNSQNDAVQVNYNTFYYSDGFGYAGGDYQMKTTSKSSGFQNQSGSFALHQNIANETRPFNYGVNWIIKL
jgi:hypothetical protein